VTTTEGGYLVRNKDGAARKVFAPRCSCFLFLLIAFGVQVSEVVDEIEFDEQVT